MATPSRTTFARARAAQCHDEDSLEIHSPAVESIHSCLVFKFYRTAMNWFNAQDLTDSSLIEGAQCELSGGESQ